MSDTNDPEDIIGIYETITADGLTWSTEIYRWPEARLSEIFATLAQLGPFDPNATAGTWPEVIRLEHTLVEWDGHPTSAFADVHATHWLGVGPGAAVLAVPVFAGDPERETWRRRKWWGRGPIRPLGSSYCMDQGSSWCARQVWCSWPSCLPF